MTAQMLPLAGRVSRDMPKMETFALLAIHNVPNVQLPQMKPNVQDAAQGTSLIVLQRVPILVQGVNMVMTVMRVILFVLVVM